ncbi:hypothetical protein KVG22_12245 [Nitratireductor sp. R6]|uniref:Uncharacterized protein n=1 Tax=Nitratireductor rhodophyticola TaxID=2854036 RepID=A0ABS7R9M5_9HYPH|nr:hypothetical protein [Nitratireductor rhodophyticola]MBY8917364.1 hypothetical protein [Nitratireductor rhodophyticola]
MPLASEVTPARAADTSANAAPVVVVLRSVSMSARLDWWIRFSLTWRATGSG